MKSVTVWHFSDNDIYPYNIPYIQWANHMGQCQYMIARRFVKEELDTPCRVPRFSCCCVPMFYYIWIWCTYICCLLFIYLSAFNERYEDCQQTVWSYLNKITKWTLIWKLLGSTYLFHCVIQILLNYKTCVASARVKSKYRPLPNDWPIVYRGYKKSWAFFWECHTVGA